MFARILLVLGDVESHVLYLLLSHYLCGHPVYECIFREHRFSYVAEKDMMETKVRDYTNGLVFAVSHLLITSPISRRRSDQRTRIEHRLASPTVLAFCNCNIK